MAIPTTEIVELWRRLTTDHQKMSVIFFQIENVFTSEQVHFCENRSDLCLFWSFSRKIVIKPCFKEVIAYHRTLTNHGLPMIESYRKAIGSKVWHFCSNCATYPAQDYTAFPFPQRMADAELCTECIARHAIGDCAGASDDSLRIKKCSINVDGKECGLALLYDLASALHICPSGHSTLIVPAAKSRKSD